ncbi:MAG TPA: triose-phosphate isomerase [Patescibacteria group bacterium]|nr:triose-phosphate isomerase [Patescibacteria group bacterium]
MRRILIVGNWKMHLNVSQSSLLAHRLQKRIDNHHEVEVVFAPSMLALQPLSVQIDRRKFRLAAQNAYHKDEGAYTGEVSFTMLQELVHYSIVGHSERRNIFNESLRDVTAKVAAAFRNGIVPILCVGETTNERLAGETNQVLHDQVVTALMNVTSPEIENLVVAYEPVWAIGTGNIAKPAQIEAAAKVIRHNISELYGNRAAESVRVLYGGSVTADTAGGFLRAKGIDGLLVGDASLNYHQFSGIVEAAYNTIHGQKTQGDN